MASQYYDRKSLSLIPEFDYVEGKIKNEEEIKRAKKELDRFIEFHFALGGLLLYRNQYSTLKYILAYTQSTPPRYPLIQVNMTDIFRWFNHFRSRDEFFDPYYFPELDNLGNKHQADKWICSYLTLLFIRQFSLRTNYVNENHTSPPLLPNDVIELNNWSDGLIFFNKCLNDLIKNTELMSELAFSEIGKEHGDDFQNYLKTLKEAIEQKIISQKKNAPLSKEKVDAFLSKTSSMVFDAFDCIQSGAKKKQGRCS